MNFKQTIFILTILFLIQYLFSCNVHKRFTLYREQPPQSLTTDGFYFQKRKELPLIFFFYKDGTAITSGENFRSDIRKEPKKLVSDLWYEATWKTNGKMQQHLVTIPWGREAGHYQIKNDSIRIQYFWFQTQRLVKRNVIELRGIVKNDSIIYITHKRTYGTKRQNSSKLKNSWEDVYHNPILLTFNKYNDHRPDSSEVWFKDKKWYREGLDK